MVKTYRIGNLERKLSETRELLARLKCGLCVDCLNSVRSILARLDRVLSEDEDDDTDTDIFAPPVA